VAETKKQTTRIAAYGIVLRDDDILLCRLSSQVPSFQGMWTLPGGGLEFGEHPEEAMIREVQEETGLNVTSTSVAGIDTFTRENTEEDFQSIRIVYQTEILGGKLRFELEGTTDMCEWHPLSRLDKLNLVSLVRAALTMTFGENT
jgi:8-oxo-dGTP diphosphatase